MSPNRCYASAQTIVYPNNHVYCNLGFEEHKKNREFAAMSISVY